MQQHGGWPPAGLARHPWQRVTVGARAPRPPRALLPPRHPSRKPSVPVYSGGCSKEVHDGGAPATAAGVAARGAGRRQRAGGAARAGAARGPPARGAGAFARAGARCCAGRAAPRRAHLPPFCGRRMSETRTFCGTVSARGARGAGAGGGRRDGRVGGRRRAAPQAAARRAAPSPEAGGRVACRPVLVPTVLVALTLQDVERRPGLDGVGCARGAAGARGVWGGGHPPARGRKRGARRGARARRRPILAGRCAAPRRPRAAPRRTHVLVQERLAAVSAHRRVRLGDHLVQHQLLRARREWWGARAAFEAGLKRTRGPQPCPGRGRWRALHAARAESARGPAAAHRRATDEEDRLAADDLDLRLGLDQPLHARQRQQLRARGGAAGGGWVRRAGVQRAPLAHGTARQRSARTRPPSLSLPLGEATSGSSCPSGTSSVGRSSDAISARGAALAHVRLAACAARPGCRTALPGPVAWRSLQPYDPGGRGGVAVGGRGWGAFKCDGRDLGGLGSSGVRCGSRDVWCRLQESRRFDGWRRRAVAVTQRRAPSGAPPPAACADLCRYAFARGQPLCAGAPAGLAPALGFPVCCGPLRQRTAASSSVGNLDGSG